MKLVVSEDMSGMSREASNWCVGKHAKSMFLPAGRTPSELYKLWEKERPAFLNGVDFLQIDDVLTGHGKGQFKQFFHDELPSYLRQFKWIERADQVAEVAILGLGLNGHVAFHEPGLSREFFSGCVKLSDTTRGVINAEPGTWGITYGVGAFMKCKSICIMVGGASKRDILKRLLARDETVPATALLEHPDITIFVDRAAYPA
jgi:6-phosphogluconolactonase/glucosamine-6-phosphate isomerase/deaminase